MDAFKRHRRCGRVGARGVITFPRSMVVRSFEPGNSRTLPGISPVLGEFAKHNNITWNLFAATKRSSCAAAFEN